MKKIITPLLIFTTSLLFSQVPNYVPTNGLGCYYSFVGNANDLYNSLNGIPNGGSYTNDAYGSQNSAYSFNGTTDFIDIPFDFFNGSTQNETSIRIKFKYNSQGDMTLWNKDGDWKELAINILSNKSIQFFGAYSNYYLDIKTVPNTIIENLWYDVVVIIANNSAKIYINGIEQLTYSVNNINNSTISFSSQGSCAINLGINRFGKSKSSCQNAYYLNGVIDEFGIWNRALTQQEITNLYNASLSTEDFSINTIDIYPNPTTSLLNFKSAIQVEKILIYNMLGQLVQQEKVNALEGTINIEKLAQGTYLVKVNDIDKGYTIIKN